MRSQIFDSIDLQRHALLPVPVQEVLFAAFRGSVAHGTYLPGSDPYSVDDIDLIGCCYGGLDHYFGLEDWGSRGTRELRVEVNGTLYDCVYYELRKFLRLLAQANPNVLASLWMEPEYYPCFSPEAEILLHCRRLFLTQQAYHSFVGYAYSQLKGVTRNKFSGYMGEKRKALVKKFGYDVKHASHLIRLLRMGVELFRDGRLTVFRPDAEELIEIKRGGWSLERVQQEANRLAKELEYYKERSTLPERPDYHAINVLSRHLLARHYRGSIHEDSYELPRALRPWWEESL